VSTTDPAQDPLLATPPLPGETSVFLVAEYFLTAAATDGRDGGALDPLKLQQLVCLAQAQHLASTGLRLFDEAVMTGPEGIHVAALAEAIGDETEIHPGFFREALRARGIELAAPAVPVAPSPTTDH